MASTLTSLPTNRRSTAKPPQSDILENLPRGVRFAPRRQELIYDLLEKNRNHNQTILTMPEVNMNQVEPWDLISKTKKGEDCYLLWKQDNKYSTGSRICRTTERGYWKSTGKDKEIYSSKEAGSKLIGMRKNLVFYLGKAPNGKNTKWVMKEFRIERSAFPDLPAQNPWVVVFITYREEMKRKKSIKLSVLRDLTAITASMEATGGLVDSTTIPAPAYGASGSSVPHSDIALLPRLTDVSCSHDTPIEPFEVMDDLHAPNYASELPMMLDSQAELPPLKKMKSMRVPDPHFISGETMDYSDQSSSEIAANYERFFNENPPNLEDCYQDQPSQRHRGNIQ